MSNRIKILHYIPGFDFGGIESRMLEIFKRIDKSKYQLDFLVLTSLDNYLIDEIKANGGNVYQVPRFNSKAIINHIKGLNNILNNTSYDAIHCHAGYNGLALLWLAKKRGIKGRILHVRTSSFGNTTWPYLKRLMQKLSIYYSNIHLAVSKIAG